jgi:hypothetical protein
LQVFVKRPHTFQVKLAWCQLFFARKRDNAAIWERG